jgi:hypothetical protein
MTTYIVVSSVVQFYMALKSILLYIKAMDFDGPLSEPNHLSNIGLLFMCTIHPIKKKQVLLAR